MNGLSLFANVGIAEAYLEELNINISVANELLKERADFYKSVYPNVNMICGDITDDIIYDEIITACQNVGIDFVIATPPCQGMSTAGRQDPNDERNVLVSYAVRMIKQLKPKFVLLENVPQQLKTYINVNGKKLLIPDYIRHSLSDDYKIQNDIVNALDYGVPQMRQRSIFLMVRKDLPYCWDFISDDDKSLPISLKNAIGNLPSLDPYIQGYSHEDLLRVFPDFERKKSEGLKVSKWHYPPTHKYRHVEVMMYTPEGKSALMNERHFPVNMDGTKVRGYGNTYKRQFWDKPAYTITTYNGAICSHDNVHPGHVIGKDSDGETIYSDPRVFSIYELMILMSLPEDWPIPDWASESLIRHAIGEGIPPLIIKKLFCNLLKEIENEKKD